MKNLRTVVELDLVGYTKTGRMLQANLGVEVVAQLNEQIQELVDMALKKAKADRKEVVRATTGDGAIVVFASNVQAHRFAVALHRAAAQHNAGRAQVGHRWFRLGLATGELHQEDSEGGSQAIAGMVIVDAVRLEAGCNPGEIVASSDTYAGFPRRIQRLYGREEMVQGKKEDQVRAHRYTVLPYTSTDEAPAIPDVLELFQRLNPTSQINLVMVLLKMPPAHRPSIKETIANQQVAILDWAIASGKLADLAQVLRSLIQKQANSVLPSVLASSLDQPIFSAKRRARKTARRATLPEKRVAQENEPPSVIERSPSFRILIDKKPRRIIILEYD